MIPSLFIMLTILTGRLGIIKIAISIKGKTHDTQTISHPPNFDRKVRNKEDHHQYEEEDP